MSEAIRSGAAAVSGMATDRGIRDAEQHADASRAEQAHYLKRGTKAAKKQLRQGAAAVQNLYQPYAAEGLSAFNQLQDTAGSFSFDPSQIEGNPAYNFRMNQGLEALDRQYAARGGIGGGGRLAGITDFAQGLASTEYENEYRRQYGEFSDRYNRLADIANVGFAATGAQAQNKQGLYSGIAGLTTGRMQGIMGIAGERGDIRAGADMGRAGNFAATNMFMGDQAAQGYDRYVPMSGGGGGGGKSGGSMKSGGGGAVG